MKSTLSLLFCCAFCLLQAQEPIPRVTRIEKAPEFYLQQLLLWEKETQRDPQNTENWYNYFIAAHYAKQRKPEQTKNYDLTEIATQMKEAIPNTFEYHYFQYLIDSWSEAGCEQLNEAYRLAPNRYQSYLGLITCGELYREEELIRKHAKNWYHSEDYSPGLATWNYNMLVNLAPQAILFTNGDNDTYPAWVLQQVQDFRRDVTVINSSMITIQSYRDLVCQALGIPELKLDEEKAGGRLDLQKAIIDHFNEKSNRPLYLAISLHPQLRDMMEDDLYLVGMAFRYDTKDFDNLPVLRQYYEQEMLTDQLGGSLHPDPAAGVLSRSNLNYLPALITLLKHYRETGEQTWLLRVKKHIRQIGEAGDYMDRVEQYLKD